MSPNPTPLRIGLNVAIGLDGPPTHAEVVAEVRAAAAAGLAAAWWPQLPPVPGLAPWDSLTSIAATAAVVDGIDVGTSVVVSYARHPLALAMQALTAQAISGNRLTLGLGTSHGPIVEGVYGASFDRPARHLREYLAVLGPALRGEPVDVHGETVTAAGTVAIPGAEPPSLVLAALGPALLRLAGELADGTLVTWAGLHAVSDTVVPRIARAAADAGRPAPRVIVNVPVCVTDDADGARALAAERFGAAGQFPSYRRMLDLDGLDGPADAVLVGTEEQVAAALARYGEAGATELLPALFGAPPDRARTLALLAELAGAQSASAV